MEEWNIKRTPMLHFCLLTSSLKPVRETCDMSVAVAQRRHWVEANLCSNSSSESRQWRTEREKAGRSAGRWHQQWEGDDRGRASERQKERETSKVSMQILFYVSAATHTPVTRPLAQQGFLCSSLSAVPCTSNYHGAAVWSPMGPSEPGPPHPESKPSLQVQNAKSMQQAAIQNPCVRMTRELTSIQDVPEEKNARYGVRQGGEVKLRK